MEPERWQKIERLCYSALNEEKSARAAFLEQACGGDEALRRAVELLLAQHEKDDNFLEFPAMEVAAKHLAQQADAALPNPLAGANLDASGLVSPYPSADSAADLTSVEQISLGPYRLLQKLGEGGMGRVWLAEQATPVRRRVALKLIKAGMYDDAVLKRFASERQSLAIMDHPSIAKVFDAGTTPDGQPYFVMEYVPGVPITDYCDQKRLNIRERMELFIKVCDGVQHAHLKAIIHRDLKPANILVTEVDGKPLPRIIDFGLAKATTLQTPDETMLTRLGSFVGTPGYMSPEQADPSLQDVDTRTDVYSLGVVLYVLLTGSLPFDSKKNVNEVLRQVREDEPPRPSTKIGMDKKSSTGSAQNRGSEPRQLEKLLRGDLDWITMKALEKDRTRRYGTPSEMAADITRYLNHEPVVARPASTAYRLHKYVRRHRIAVAVATGLVAVLVAFVVLQRVQLQRTRLERDRATRITDFMTGMFQVSDPSEQRGNSVTAREILDKASKDIETGLAKDPDAQAEMMQVMGEVYINLGLFSRARDLEQRSLEIRRRVLGPENPDTLASMNDLAGALNENGHYAEAVKMFREEFDIERRVLGPENPQTLNSMSSLADALWRDGHSEEAEKLNRETLDLRRRVLGPENRDTLKSMSNWALDLNALGRYSDAEKLDREILDIRRRVLGPEHPDTLLSMNNLAVDLIAERRFPEAEKLDRETLDLRRRVLGPEHFETLKSMSNLAFVLSREGRYADAEKLDREAFDIRRRVLGPEHPDTLISMNNLSNSLMNGGHYAEAEKLLRESLDIWRRIRDPENWWVLKTMKDLALVLSREGRYAAAEKLARDTINISRRVFGLENPLTASSVYNLGGIEARVGNRSEALSLLRQAVDNGLPSSDALAMESNPDLKSLYRDPRFITMVADAKERAAAAPSSVRY
jgi:eukaryotic-like serine/threonine-protein kinase